MSADLGAEKLDDVERFAQSMLGGEQSVLETASDPTLSKFLFDHSFRRNNTSRFGRIQASIPYLGWYRVAVDGLFGVIPCGRAGSDCTASIFGVVDTVTLPPDTAVLVELHPSGRYGFITGTVPSIMEDGNQVFSDWVSQGSNASFREAYHSAYVTQTGDEGGSIDFSGQRPLDNLTTDWGRCTTTGTGLHLDPFLAYLRASELCGVFAFQLGERETLRVAGSELQVLSACHQELYLCDEGELTSYYGETPYPWEKLGGFSSSTTIHRTSSDQEVHNQRYFGKLEPLHDDQKAFHRYEEYGGYLGQGRIRQMMIPPAGAAGTVYRHDPDQLPVGVFREFIGLNGSYYLGSAKEVTIAKDTLQLVAKQVKPAVDYEQSDCDSVENRNYRFAGTYGTNGDAHKINDLANPNGNLSSLVSVMGVLDGQTFVSNWQSQLAFHYHKLDFVLPEAQESAQARNQEELDFYQLVSQPGFSPEAPQSYQVDGRGWTTKLYRLLSMLKLTDDGGVVLQGGYGEQIRFVRGEIYIDAPAHIHVRSGKGIYQLAGDDWVVRAHNSADVTTTNKDIRLKAEKSLSMLAANSGTGTLLLECRSTTKEQKYTDEGGEDNEGSGVIVKVPKSQFGVLASEIYLRTGNTEGEIDEGRIVIDAAKGNQDVVVIGRRVEQFAKLDYRFNLSYPRVAVVHEFNRSRALFGTEAEVLGTVKARGRVIAKDGMEVSDGHYASLNGGLVNRLLNPAAVRAGLDAINTQHNELKAQETENYDSGVKKTYYDATKLGNNEQQKRVSFSLRLQKDYNTDSFDTPQAHWWLLTGGSGATKVWREKKVLYRGEKELLPWPGKKKWLEDATLVTLPSNQHTLYDVAQGAPKNRVSGEAASYGQAQAVIPDQGYLIVNVP